MQNINNQLQEGAETYSTINQGFDFQSFPYEDFALVSDAVVTINPQITVSQSEENYSDLLCWNSSVVNSHTDHVNPQSQEQFLCWNSSPVNSLTNVIYDHVNSQSQEQWNSLAQNEIFEGLPNMDQHQSIFASQHLSYDEKASPLESNKERSRIFKDASISKLGSRDDDAVVISEEKFTRKKNKRSKKSEMHNQSERNRRNAIKEKIHTLGGLLPNCTKTDQASILSDVVDHVKSLICQRQMLSMVGHPMWLAGAQNDIPQQIPQYMPCMGMGMDRVNMYGYSAGGTSFPFLSFPSAPSTPSFPMPILSESNIVSYPQLQVPPPPLSPTVTFNATDTVVQPQPNPYTMNHANQGESCTSQYNTIGTRHHNQKVPTLSEKYKVMASGRILPHSGP